MQLAFVVFSALSGWIPNPLSRAMSMSILIIFKDVDGEVAPIPRSYRDILFFD